MYSFFIDLISSVEHAKILTTKHANHLFIIGSYIETKRSAPVKLHSTSIHSHTSIIKKKRA